ncbi:MAG: hypothetical protein OXB92_02270 [Acidimicrobiaceae bacterium]|nr:hypothetical protein [Acidimicrobiia bacterium]MCY4492669.1 hypothetical protein [Acidimicrobiaceae bacterium]
MTEENNTENAETNSVVGPGLPPTPGSSEPLPPASNSSLAGQQLPSGLPTWLSSDWLVVIVASIGVFLSSIAAGAILGAINALAFTSSFGATISGAITGIYLGFSSFAVEITAVNTESEFQAIIATKYLPIAWYIGFVAIVWYGYRFCEQRMESSVENRRALTIKMAITFGLVAAVGGALLSFNEDSIYSNLLLPSNDGLSARVNSGTAFLYGAIFVAVVGLFFHNRSKQPILRGFARKVDENILFRNFSSDLLEGARMYLIALGSMGVLGLAGAMYIAETMRDRILLIVGFPLYLGNLGIATATIAMGGSVEVLGSVDNHISLMNWHWAGGERAPIFFFVIVLVIPALLFWRTTLYLDSRGSQSESDLLGASLRLALGFTLTSWILSLLGRLQLTSGVIGRDLDFYQVFEPIKSFVFAASPRASFGLGLLWSLGVCLLAALLWGQKRGLKLFNSLAASGNEQQQPDLPPRPPS